MAYIISLLIFISIYIATIMLMKYMTNKTLTNIIFASLVFIPYIIFVLIVYFDVGFNDWNFQNTLLFANISPFMFSMIPIILLMPIKLKKHFLLLISLLCVGMFLSSTLACLGHFTNHSKFHHHFLLDYISHFALSLWGIYLIKSKQVSVTTLNSLISSLIIIGIALFMLLHNLIFDTTFFGLSISGKHNIYNNVLVSNSYLSAIIYFLGLIFVLCLGYIVNKELIKKSKN